MFLTNIIVLLPFVLINGQLTQFLLPSLAETARTITNGLTKNPFIQIPIEASAEILAFSLNSLTNLQLEIARWFNFENFQPKLINNRNIADITDKFFVEFNSGLSDEDAKLNISELVTKYGYTLEKHTVLTKDGHILNLFRIPGNGTAVFLMHGLFGSADDFVIFGPNHGLAFLLADQGYDVWMGNARGNKHSRRHASIQPFEAKFWDFSWHEIGYYDLPAMIDYVLSETELDSLQYIGHSQGTTTFFVMVSERPEYNEKISLMIALSPVAYMSNVKSPLVRLLSPGTPIFYTAAKLIGAHEFFPDNAIVRTFKKLLCGTSPISEVMCGNIMFIFGGFSLEQLYVFKLPVFFGHLPAGASAKQVTHYGQGVLSRDFRKFDYGISENVQRYGQSKPPNYRLGNIKVPVVLFYSTDDWLAQPADVYELSKKLQNVQLYKIQFEPFSHLDFLWARDFKLLVFEKLISILK